MHWGLGTDDAYLRALLAYWHGDYDWARKEAELNRYPQFTCELDGVTIHFFHIRGSHRGAPALLLTHGWPDSFLRYAKVFPLLTMDDILDCLTLCWMTNTACTSIRAYHGNTFTSPPMGRITVPTAIAAFPHDVLPAPREWVERNCPVIQYTEMPRGGHFTALEQPEQFADSIMQFMNAIF